MAKLTLSDISNLADTTASQTTINANNALIETALENTVSRDGTSPNNMSGNIDMNSHSILNLTKPVGVNDAAREQDILDAVAALGVNADIITGGGSVSLTSQVTGVLPVANGGTGTAVYTIGDILSSNSANALSKIPGNITTTRKYLMSQGTGAIASPVQWQQVAGSDIAGTPLTKTDDTNVTLTLGGTPNVALLNPASITAGWTGTLAPSRGGTGFGSYTTGDLLVASGASALTKLSDVATGNAVISGGVGAAPSYGKITTSHISGTTGSGNFVLDTAPTLVTPTIGAATATSVNKVALTAPATAATLTIANNKTLTANNSLTLAGTDGTTMTFPGTTGSVLTADSTNTLTNKTYDTAGTGNSFSINGVAANANTGTGSVVRATTPTLITPVLGAATATSINFGGTTLSNYVEGTWTPVITTDGTVGTPAYAGQIGTYTRIGRVVTAYFNVTLSGWTGSPTGNVTITGLPLTANATANYAGTLGFYSIASAPASSTGMNVRVVGGTTSIFPQTCQATGVTQLTAAQAGTTPNLQGTVSYHV